MPLKIITNLKSNYSYYQNGGQIADQFSHTLLEKYAIEIMLTAVSSAICTCDELVSS
jgi:hypothetical protein